MVPRISSYVLTHDASPHLGLILQRLCEFSDEVLLVDSGGRTNVVQLASEHGCAIHFRQFDDFVGQREFANSLCRYEYIFFCDTDEVPSPELVEELVRLKTAGLRDDLYSVQRRWYAFGRPVRAVYPVVSPDYPARLARRAAAIFEPCRTVHERYLGYDRATRIDAPLLHYTFNSDREILNKLQRYSALEAFGVERRYPAATTAWWLLKRLTSPIGAFFQWYIMRRGFMDGWVGFKLSTYAAACKSRKYRRPVPRATACY